MKLVEIMSCIYCGERLSWYDDDETWNCFNDECEFTYEITDYEMKQEILKDGN